MNTKGGYEQLLVAYRQVSTRFEGRQRRAGKYEQILLHTAKQLSAALEHGTGREGGEAILTPFAREKWT